MASTTMQDPAKIPVPQSIIGWNIQHHCWAIRVFPFETEKAAKEYVAVLPSVLEELAAARLRIEQLEALCKDLESDSVAAPLGKNGSDDREDIVAVPSSMVAGEDRLRPGDVVMVRGVVRRIDHGDQVKIRLPRDGEDFWVRRSDIAAGEDGLLEAMTGIVEKSIAEWAAVEDEYRTPKNDLSATLVRTAAKHKRELAEDILAKMTSLGTPQIPSNGQGETS